MSELTTKVTAITNLREMKIIIKNELESLVDGFVSLGYYLKKTRDTEMYKEDGYENIYEFAKDVFNLSKSTVSRYMAINDRFSMDGNNPELAEEFRGFGSSKLSEMLVLTDEQLENITPDATISDIREYKKIVSENEVVATSQQGINTEGNTNFDTPNTSLLEFVKSYFKGEGRNVFEKAIAIVLSAAEDQQIKIMYAIAPSKYKIIHIPGGNALCNAEAITIMKIGQARETFTYGELIEVIKYIFNPSDSRTAAETFKDYYQEDLVPVKVEVKISEPKQQELKQTTKQEPKKEQKQEPKQENKKESKQEEIQEQKDTKNMINTQSEDEEEEEKEIQEENEDYEDTDSNDEEDSITENEDTKELEDNIPGQHTIEDYTEYLPENTETLEGEVIHGPIKDTSDYASQPADYIEDDEPDGTILLANQLQKVIEAKQEYQKQVRKYSELAAENGVSKSAIDYVLDQIEDEEGIDEN